MSKVPLCPTIEPELPPERNVYPNREDCRYGLAIEARHLRYGKAGRPKCLECKRLGKS